MTSTPTHAHTCPSPCAAANHPGYEHDWWVEAYPVTAAAEAELTSLTLGKTATQAAKAILAAGYRKADLPETTPCCGASEACRDCPTD